MNVNFLRGFDNKGIDLGRVLWALGTIAYLAITAYAVKLGQQINWIEWAIGFATIHGIGAGGAGLKDIAVAKAMAIRLAAQATGEATP